MQNTLNKTEHTSVAVTRQWIPGRWNDFNNNNN